MDKRWRLIALAFVALSVLTTYSWLRRAKPAPRDGESVRYLYCPECGLEMTCPPGDEDKATFCPHCGKSRQMEVHSFSLNGGGGPGFRANRTLLAVAFGVPIALAVLVYLLRRLQARREREVEADTRQIACPACGHELSTAIFGPGSTAVCPECAERFVVRGIGERSGGS